MSASEKHNRLLQLAKITLREISGNIQEDDLDLRHEQICDLIKKLEISIDRTKDHMLDEEKTLEEISGWSSSQGQQLVEFRNLRADLKKRLAAKERDILQMEMKKEIEKQKAINEEVTQARLREQKDLEAVSRRRIEMEEKWLERKLKLEQEAREFAETTGRPTQQPSTQAVKLQKYTITPFNGDYKDWIRFWNQFTVEVDGSAISNISKFHYLLEPTKGKPREDILGLPHTDEGYEEAKKILTSTYGKDIKVHKALIKELESLHSISSVHRIGSIHDFYNKLSRVVRTLKTMKKLETAQSTVYTIMDKLGPVREVIAQGDDGWEEWKLEQLTENLRKYVDRNPMKSGDEGKFDSTIRPGERLLFGNGQGNKKGSGRCDRCAYCGSNQHRSVNCTRVLSIANRRDILRKNKLCFNCTGQGHSASNCRSRSCAQCGQKHHTSLCERQLSTMGEQASEKSMSAANSGTSTIHATVKGKISGEEVRIMIDTGASSSYICSGIITRHSFKPVRQEIRCIEQMYGTVTRNVEIYRVNIASTAVEGFSLDVNCINAEKTVLTYLPNPRIEQLKQRYARLRRLHFGDESASERQLPIHIILGAGDYQRIRSTEQPIVGENPDTDPGAEFTMMGWTMLGRQGNDLSCAEKGFFARSSQSEFEKLCSLDVLGLTDKGTSDSEFHEDFIEHLQRTKDSYYETRLPWKQDHLAVPSNKELATARLRSTTRRLEKIGKLSEYNDVLQEHIREGVIEKVPARPTGEIIHYIPHQAVIREEAESTKLRVVYDCSAKQNAQVPSLNDCLEVGPALQPKLFDIMIRNRMKRHCIDGDVKKAFLQIRVKEEDRDAQRILWYDNLKDRNIIEYRLARVIFGAGPSPYILGATLQKHVSQYKDSHPETAKALLQDTYVDDIQYGGESVEELHKFKREATEIMMEGGFLLHKWHSDIPLFESGMKNNELVNGDEERVHTSKILGIEWDKEKDTLSINFGPLLTTISNVTKRKMLAFINGVYDVLGWVAPVMISAKILFSEVCLRKLSWDEAVPEGIQRSWNQWIKRLKECPSINVPRSVVNSSEGKISLQGFADASKLAVCAAIYVLITYSDGNTEQNLLVAKSRIAPKDVSIPRLELVAAHMLAKLMNHVQKTLCITSEVDLWSDSMTTLYWLASKGTWSQYVRNRVKAIRELGEWRWHYIPTNENPSDLGTRGLPPAKLSEFWFKGPHWLSDKSSWPTEPEIIETESALAEAIPRRKEHALMEQQLDQTETPDRDEWANSLLEKYTYWKLLRITAYIKRFAYNCTHRAMISGPLTTEEIGKAETTWLKYIQEGHDLTNETELRKDSMGIWRCVGRIEGYHPIFIPRKSPLAAKIIEHFHKFTLHGGVQSMMGQIREKFWIPQLRRLVKTVRYRCNKCKGQRAKVSLPKGISVLPTFRTQLSEPFYTTGVDFAGPLYYKVGKGNTQKAYIILFTCASTRAVHLVLCKSMAVEEFKRALKWFVARRGKPNTIISDNAKTFKAARTWLQSVKDSDEINNYLSKESIKWKFNLSRAPWWGRFLNA